jgi:hypothetical protein
VAGCYRHRHGSAALKQSKRRRRAIPVSPRFRSNAHGTATRAKGHRVSTRCHPGVEQCGLPSVLLAQWELADVKYRRRPRPRAGVASRSRYCEVRIDASAMYPGGEGPSILKSSSRGLSQSFTSTETSEDGREESSRLQSRSVAETEMCWEGHRKCSARALPPRKHGTARCDGDGVISRAQPKPCKHGNEV